MSIAKRASLSVKAIAVAAAAVLTLIGFGGISTEHMTADASASGPSPTFTGAPGEGNCTACHSSFPADTGTGNVQIAGIPANYLPGQQIPVTVTVNQSDAVIFGFQMTAVNPSGGRVGAYMIPPASPPILQTDIGFVGVQERQYIHHTINGITPTVFGTKSWQFTWTAPSRRVGKIGFYAAGNGADSNGGTSGDQIYTTSRAALSGSAISSFDGDGTSDVAVFRPSTGAWFSLNSNNGGFQGVNFGIAGDKPAGGDYDGDGKTDRAVFRPSTGVWYVLQSSNSGVAIYGFGINGDLPVPGDYDGDLKTDVAVYRPSTGVWYVLRSTGGVTAFAFGTTGDRTAQGDYDGDAKTDFAVFRPSTGVWYIARSADGTIAQQFGVSGDQPVQGDYDGDGRHDIAVWRPSNGVWYIQASSGGFLGNQFGVSTDKVVPADYDGDGKTDLAVWRPSTAVWYAIRSSDSSFFITTFGLSGDVPVAGTYLPE